MANQTVTVRLKRSVSGLGNVGDVLRVKFGYARNYLLANGSATIVGERTGAKAIESQRNRVTEQMTKHKAVMDIAASLNGRAVTMFVLASPEGRLFASVQTNDVATALDVDPIFRMEPLKKTGTHTVTLDFGHDIVSSVTVTLQTAASAADRKNK